MAEDPRELFAEYADAYARGDRPRATDFLARAGRDAEALATMLERFLATARPPTPTAEEVQRVSALLDTPLLELRKRRRLRVDDVVDALMTALGVAGEKREKLRLYYQRLENGTLDPRGVSEKVWGALESSLGGKVVLAPPPEELRVDAEVAYYRADALAAPPAPAASGRLESSYPEERDEVDELFLGAAA